VAGSYVRKSEYLLDGGRKPPADQGDLRGARTPSSRAERRVPPQSNVFMVGSPIRSRARSGARSRRNRETDDTIRGGDKRTVGPQMVRRGRDRSFSGNRSPKASSRVMATLAAAPCSTARWLRRDWRYRRNADHRVVRSRLPSTKRSAVLSRRAVARTERSAQPQRRNEPRCRDGPEVSTASRSGPRRVRQRAACPDADVEGAHCPAGKRL